MAGPNNYSTNSKSTDDVGSSSIEASPSLTSAHESQPLIMKEFGFGLGRYPFDERRNALAELPPPRLSRGNTTDTQPMTNRDYEEAQHERELAAVIPRDALNAARVTTTSERSATLLAAKWVIEDLKKGIDDRDNGMKEPRGKYRGRREDVEDGEKRMEACTKSRVATNKNIEELVEELELSMLEEEVEIDSGATEGKEMDGKEKEDLKG